MQKIYVVLTGLVGLGVYVVLDKPLGQWGAIAAAIVLAVGAMWAVTLVAAETRNDARIVAIGLSVLAWLYLIAIVLKKGGEQADKVGAWAVAVEAVLLTGPVWLLVWGVRRMARDRRLLPQTVPVTTSAVASAQAAGLGFADELRVGALSGVLLGYAGRILNPETGEVDRHKAYAAGVGKAVKSLRKRPQLGPSLLDEIRKDDAPQAQRDLAERMVHQAAAELNPPR